MQHLLPQRIRICSGTRFFAKHRSRNVIKTQAPETENVPEFQELLRKLYKKGHPDLLRSSNEEFAEENDKAFQVLNGILSIIKNVNEYPPQTVKRIRFHLRGNKVGEFKLAELSICTAGGDCRKSLTNSFQLFFKAADIYQGRFNWGKEYFPTQGFE